MRKGSERLIVEEVQSLGGEARPSDLEKRLKGKVSRRTIYNKLKFLTKEGILLKRIDETKSPPSVYYFLPSVERFLTWQEAKLGRTLKGCLALVLFSSILAFPWLGLKPIPHDLILLLPYTLLGIGALTFTRYVFKEWMLEDRAFLWLVASFFMIPVTASRKLSDLWMNTALLFPLLFLLMVARYYIIAKVSSRREKANAYVRAQQ